MVVRQHVVVMKVFLAATLVVVIAILVVEIVMMAERAKMEAVAFLAKKQFALFFKKASCEGAFSIALFTKTTLAFTLKHSFFSSN